MTIRPAWFQRSFALGTPPERFAEIVERLRGTPLRVEERVSGLDHRRLTARSGDRWSIQEHVGHLMDLEPLWAARVEDLMAGLDRLRPADLENRATWDAHHNEVPVTAVLEGFRTLRAALVSRLEGLTPEQRTRTALHPRLEQPMSVVDLAFFVAEHDDHHLATITALWAEGDEA